MVVKVTMLSHIYFLLFKRISPFGIKYIYIYVIYIYTYIYIYIYVNLKGIARISANTSKMEKLIKTVNG